MTSTVTNRAFPHLDDVGGYPGAARCYRLDPPQQFNGVPHEYVTVWIQPRYAHQAAEVAVVAATESGSAATNSMLRGPGSFVLHDEPDTSEYVEGAYRMALGLLGGYAIEEEAHGDR